MDLLVSIALMPPGLARSAGDHVPHPGVQSVP
jgi:hypothetical protein